MSGTERTEKSVQKDNKTLSAERKAEVDEATQPENGILSWSVYEDSINNKNNVEKGQDSNKQKKSTTKKGLK